VPAVRYLPSAFAVRLIVVVDYGAFALLIAFWLRLRCYTLPLLYVADWWLCVAVLRYALPAFALPLAVRVTGVPLRVAYVVVAVAGGTVLVIGYVVHGYSPGSVCCRCCCSIRCRLPVVVTLRWFRCALLRLRCTVRYVVVDDGVFVLLRGAGLRLMLLLCCCRYCCLMLLTGGGIVLVVIVVVIVAVVIDAISLPFVPFVVLVAVVFALLHTFIRLFVVAVAFD
jgi:hypothetical protein